MCILLPQGNQWYVTIGPFLSDTDFKTPQTGLSLVQADHQISKNAGTFAQKNDASSSAHMSNGIYQCSFNGTDTNTLGFLTLFVAKTGAVIYKADFLVVTTNIYNAWHASTIQTVNATQIGTNSTAATNLATRAQAMISGQAVTGTLTTTEFTTNISGYSSKQLVRRILTWTTGPCFGERVIIVDYNQTNGRILVAPPLTTAPANTNNFIIE